MKIALAAARQIDRDIEWNLGRMKRFMELAKADGADLVCFGETFLQGFDCFDWEFEQDRQMAVTLVSEPIRRIAHLTRELDLDVMFGFAELAGESIYSSAVLIAAGQVKQLYRRISRGWKEYSRTDEHYREGEEVPVFEYRGRKFSIGLCGDLWDHPERFALEEDVLLWPVYISYTPQQWESGVREEYAHQAAKCCSKTLLVNCVCDGDASGGAAYFEDGKTVSALPMGGEGILMVEI